MRRHRRVAAVGGGLASPTAGGRGRRARAAAVRPGRGHPPHALLWVALVGPRVDRCVRPISRIERSRPPPHLQHSRNTPSFAHSLPRSLPPPSPTPARPQAAAAAASASCAPPTPSPTHRSTRSLPPSLASSLAPVFARSLAPIQPGDTAESVGVCARRICRATVGPPPSGPAGPGCWAAAEALAGRRAGSDGRTAWPGRSWHRSGSCGPRALHCVTAV